MARILMESSALGRVRPVIDGFSCKDVSLDDAYLTVRHVTCSMAPPFPTFGNALISVLGFSVCELLAPITRQGFKLSTVPIQSNGDRLSRKPMHSPHVGGGTSTKISSL